MPHDISNGWTPDPQRWIAEGDGLRASALAMREQWVALRTRIRHVDDGETHPLRHAATAPRTWSELQGWPRASMLLLGYAVEMYLKAALVKAYRGCRGAYGQQTGMFDRDVRRFGHGYVRLAAAIEFATSDSQRRELGLLHEMVVDSARYPLMPDHAMTGTDPHRVDALNATTRAIWSEDQFVSLDDLVGQVREHASRIDQDSKVPAHFGPCVRIDDDGYFVSRSGGRLSPRIVFRYSRKMTQTGRGHLEALREEVVASCDWHAAHVWNSATILEAGAQRTHCRRGDGSFAPA